ncbi:hypothetical protein NKH77_42000 [Streptomyces sp. M19]
MSGGAVRLPSGDEAVLLTRYADVRTALADPRLSREGWPRPTPPGWRPVTPSVFTSPMAKALNAEGHGRWRRMVGKWFTAKRMSALRPRMEDMAERLVDEMRDHGAPRIWWRTWPSHCRCSSSAPCSACRRATGSGSSPGPTRS